MDWRVLFRFAKLNVAVVSRALVNLLGLLVNVKLGVGRLDLALVEHRLQSVVLHECLCVEEFDLEEVVAIVEVVCHEVDHELLELKVLVGPEVGVHGSHERVHLLID